MHRSPATSPIALAHPVRRSASWVRLLSVAGCVAVLAGCAGQRTAYNDDGIPYDAVELASRSGDPIGDLIAYRAKHGNISRLPGANNPLVGEALTYLGVRYRFGGSSPDAGFDCSGLVAYSAQRSLGLKLPRNAAEIAGWGVSIDRSQLSPGDLVFFNTLGRRFSHVGIYMGANEFVHSPSAGGVVRVENMTSAYWAKRYNGARRLGDRDIATASR